MFPKFAGVFVVVISFLVAALTNAQGPKETTGTIIGELKARKNTPDAKNTFIDVLAPGEEKPRAYHVNYDPKIKGPIPAVLAAVRAANIGDRVEFEFVQTGHGPAIRTFKVIRKKDEKKR